MPQYNSAKEAINARLSGNTAMGPKNVPGTTGAVGGVVRNKPTPSIFDAPSANETGSTIDINKPTTPYNSLYGQTNTTGNGLLNQTASGGTQTTSRNQGATNQFGSQVPSIQSQGYQAYTPLSQGLVDYNLSQPSTSSGAKAVSGAYSQAADVKNIGGQVIANQFANQDYRGLQNSQMQAASMEAKYKNQADQNAQIEKAIAQKQALDLQQKALTESYQAKTELTKLKYQNTIRDTADSLNKAQAGILEAVGNDIVNLTALSDAKGHMMTGQMILDNLASQQNIDLDQIANDYTNNIQSSINTFLANNSRIGIAAAGMIKDLEANGALDTAKGQMEASNIMQMAYASIGQSSQNLTQSLQYYNQFAKQQADIAYQKASLAQNQRQFEISNQLEREKLDFQRGTQKFGTTVDNATGNIISENKKTGGKRIQDSEGNILYEDNNFSEGLDLEGALSKPELVQNGQWTGDTNGLGLLAMPKGSTIKGTIKEANYILQCAEWISRALGIKVGNTYAEKLQLNSEKSGGIGSIAVWNPGGDYAEYGHAGLIIGDEGDYWKVKSANYNGDGKITIDTIPKSRIEGYRTTELSGKPTASVGTSATGTAGTTGTSSGPITTQSGKVLTSSAADSYRSKFVSNDANGKRVLNELKKAGVFNEGEGNEAFYKGSDTYIPKINKFISAMEKWQEVKDVIKRNDSGFLSSFGSFNNLSQMMGGADKAAIWAKTQLGWDSDFVKDYYKLENLLNQEMSAYMKELSGLTISDKERVNLQTQIPNLDMSEIQFREAVDLYDKYIDRQKQEIMSDFKFKDWDSVSKVARGTPGNESGQSIDDLATEFEKKYSSN